MKLLSAIVLHVPRMVCTYAEAIYKALEGHLNSPYPSVASGALEAIGSLAVATGGKLRTQLLSLMPLIVETLSDQMSGSKRHIAVLVLGQIAQSTGYVIEPYTDYPRLMNVLVSVFTEEKNPEIRQEVIRVFGILGALDPWQEAINRTAALEEAAASQQRKTQAVRTLLAARGL